MKWQIFSRAEKGDEQMLGIIAAVLIVLWLLGFFAFHVTTSFIHVVLVVGVILLVLHFMRRGTASV
jgi:membrane-bound ClpP family serine protease